MSQLSSVIKFLAAQRMKEEQEGGKSCAGELGGGKRTKCQNVVFLELTFMQGGGDTCRGGGGGGG